MKEILAVILSLLVCSCDKPTGQQEQNVDVQQTAPQQKEKDATDSQREQEGKTAKQQEQQPPKKAELPKAKITVANKEIEVEIAATRFSRAKGYMFREEIPDGTGMIFVFNTSGYRQFIMDNCLVDIDIVFIDGDGYIVSAAEMKKPSPGMASEYYDSKFRCRYALELPAGSIESLKLRKNMRIIIPDEIKYILTEDD
ncbi:MAG: DUF192 domain-containing protein [Phycisphaerae bacterium]|nr:DUF192 domain-containing protein [Phycisphaerae bacterium]